MFHIHRLLSPNVYLFCIFRPIVNCLYLINVKCVKTIVSKVQEKMSGALTMSLSMKHWWFSCAIRKQVFRMQNWNKRIKKNPTFHSALIIQRIGRRISITVWSGFNAFEWRWWCAWIRRAHLNRNNLCWQCIDETKRAVRDWTQSARGRETASQRGNDYAFKSSWNGFSFK